MKSISCPIADVITIEPKVHTDARGRFVETYRRSWFPLGREMTQANRGDRQVGSLVGLHYHLHQADYWLVPFGKARIVLHDLRVGSPSEGVTWSIELGLNQPDDRGIFIPPGVAHGFVALSDMTITYLVDSYYNAADELGVVWNDPEIKAEWGIAEPIVSDRDQHNPLRKDLPANRQPYYELRGR